jgi:hypothetical protein
VNISKFCVYLTVYLSGSNITRKTITAHTHSECSRIQKCRRAITSRDIHRFARRKRAPDLAFLPTRLDQRRPKRAAPRNDRDLFVLEYIQAHIPCPIPSFIPGRTYVTIRLSYVSKHCGSAGDSCSRAHSPSRARLFQSPSRTASGARRSFADSALSMPPDLLYAPFRDLDSKYTDFDQCPRAWVRMPTAPRYERHRTRP